MAKNNWAHQDPAVAQFRYTLFLKWGSIGRHTGTAVLAKNNWAHQDPAVAQFRYSLFLQWGSIGGHTGTAVLANEQLYILDFFNGAQEAGMQAEQSW